MQNTGNKEIWQVSRKSKIKNKTHGFIWKIRSQKHIGLHKRKKLESNRPMPSKFWREIIASMEFLYPAKLPIKSKGRIKHFQTWRPQKFYFCSFFLNNKNKEVNIEREINGIQETRDLAEKRREGNFQNADKERFQNKSLLSLPQFPYLWNRELTIIPIS